MRKIVRNKMNKKINKKQLSLLLASSIALTSLAGCGSKTLNEQTTTVTPSTTVATTSTATPEVTITNIVETKDNQASIEYMNHAQAVAEAMYEANKDYFDEKQYTVEDLENVYYVLNGKYYDNEDNIIMDQVELNRSFDAIRELTAPQSVNEMLQKQSDVDHGYLSYEDYMREVDEYKFYDYSASLANFIDGNEDIINFSNDFSEEMYKITEDVKNCVSPEEHVTDFFGVIWSAQTGDKSNYPNINNYLQETTANDGYGFMVAAMYKSIADFANTLIDGEYIEVPEIVNGETTTVRVRIGLTYDERLLLNAYYLGDLVYTEETEDAYLRAKHLESELFQTMPLMVMCDKEEKIVSLFNFEPVKGKTKKYTI